MSETKLEIRIIEDSTKTKVSLDGLTVEAAQAFVKILENIASILEGDNATKNTKIKLINSSLGLLIDDSKAVKKLHENFEDVVNDKSINETLIKSWQGIQKLFSNNGLTYDAKFTIDDKKIPLYEMLTKGKVIKMFATNRLSTNIIFKTGTLIAVGGKNPNIHVNNIDTDGIIIIECSKKNAEKSKAFLYHKIIYSARVIKTNKGTDYFLCDSYYEKDINIFNSFKEFIDKLDLENEMDQLRILHQTCMDYVDKKEYILLKKFLRLFNHKSTSLNILKTLLITSQAAKENGDIGELWDNLKLVFDKNMKEHNKNIKKQKVGNKKNNRKLTA